MRTHLGPLLVAGSLATLVIAPMERVARSATISPESTAEVRRVRAHFDSVLAELASRDVSALNRQQQANRAALIATLDAYRDRGAFPKNYDFPGRAVPYFVDRKTGILCAVAHLLASTGRRDIVDRVAAANNNVWVPALAGDTAFTGWLGASGLTLNEAARIQVPYSGGPSASDPLVLTSIAVGTVAVGTTVWNVAANRDGRMPLASFVGVLSGVTSIALGVGAAAQDATPDLVAMTNFGVGALSSVVAASGLMRRQQLSAARRAAERRRDTGEKSGVETTVTPTFSASQKAAGVMVQVRF